MFVPYLIIVAAFTLSVTVPARTQEEHWGAFMACKIVYCGGVGLFGSFAGYELVKMIMSKENVLDVDEDNDVSWDEVLHFIHKNLSLILNFTIVLCTIAELYYSSEGRNVAQALNGLLIWCNVMHMLLPFEYFGVLTIIIYKILFKDILRFVVVFSLLLLGFAQSFAILFEKQDTHEIGYAYPFRRVPRSVFFVLCT